MKPLPLDEANRLAVDLTHLDKQTRYVIRSNKDPKRYVIITEHEADPNAFLGKGWK